jgi:hypothetical protein
LVWQVLLRAFPEPGSSSVVVEARLLSEHLPLHAGRSLAEEGGAGALVVAAVSEQLLYYQDSSTHAAQESARKAWRTQPAGTKRPLGAGGGGGVSAGGSALKTAKRVKLAAVTPTASSLADLECEAGVVTASGKKKNIPSQG